MRFFTSLMGVSCYYLCSNLSYVLCRVGGHAGCHGVTNPTAQWQQGNQEDNKQMAHEGLQILKVLPSQVIYQSVAAHSVKNMQAFLSTGHDHQSIQLTQSDKTATQRNNTCMQI